MVAKPKSDAVKQELERHEEVLVSALRCIAALHSVPGAAATDRFKALESKCLSSGAMAPKWEAAKLSVAQGGEAAAAGGADSAEAMDTA